MFNSRKIKALFNIKKTAEKDDSYYHSYQPIKDLTSLGYNGLFQLHLHLSIQGITRWQKQKQIIFPEKCCICNKPQKKLLTIYKKSKWGKPLVPFLLDVPHCEKHGQNKEAKLIVKSYYYYSFEYNGLFRFLKNKEKYKNLEQYLTSIIILGVNHDFLQELLKINTQNDGDFYPPWIAFKNSNPYSFKQGIQEAWYHRSWIPFKETLGKDGYNNYLEKWDASNEWIEHNKMSNAFLEKGI